MVRFGNNSPCLVKGKGFISLNSKRNVDDVCIIEGLTHIFLIFGHLNDKWYHIDKGSKMIDMSTPSGSKLKSWGEEQEQW